MCVLTAASAALGQAPTQPSPSEPDAWTESGCTATAMSRLEATAADVEAARRALSDTARAACWKKGLAVLALAADPTFMGFATSLLEAEPETLRERGVSPRHLRRALVALPKFIGVYSNLAHDADATTLLFAASSPAWWTRKPLLGSAWFCGRLPCASMASILRTNAVRGTSYAASDAAMVFFAVKELEARLARQGLWLLELQEARSRAEDVRRRGLLTVLRSPRSHFDIREVPVGQ